MPDCCIVLYGAAEHLLIVVCVVQYGLGTTQRMDCPRNMVGRVIGKQGETIKQLQRNTGANIQIDQKSDPCTITITGPKNSCSNAMREITAITSDPAMGGVLAASGLPCCLLCCTVLPCPPSCEVESCETPHGLYFRAFLYNK